MASPRRSWLLVEVAVAFGPAAVLLALGLFIAVMQIPFLVLSAEARADPGGGLELIAISLGGVLGFAALADVMRILVYEANRMLPSWATVVCALIGQGVLAYLITDSETMAWRMFFAVPLVVSLHVMYLARGSVLRRR